MGSLTSSMFNTYIMKNFTPTIEIEKYTEICLKDTQLASEQLVCRHLTGFQIEFEATVEKTSIESVKNKANDLTSQLPVLVADYINCLFGDTYPNNKSCSKTDTLNESDKIMCNITSAIRNKKKCHLNRYNEYNFGIKVKVDDANTISVEADDSHTEMVFSLLKKEKVTLRTVVENNGSKLSVLSMNKGKIVKGRKEHTKTFSKPFSAIECSFNFFFSPLLTLNLPNKNNIC